MENSDNAPPNPNPNQTPFFKKNKKKRNKKKKTQQPAFWAKLNEPKGNVLTNLVQPWADSESKFSTPVKVKPEENVAELVDDTTPNVTAPSWKPVGVKSNTPVKAAAGKTPQVRVTPTRAQKWQIFKASLEKKTENERFVKEHIQQKSSPQFTPNAYQNPNPPETAKNEETNPGKDIFWELNDVDFSSSSEQKEAPSMPEHQQEAAQQPEIIQGSASDIKLVLQNKQKSMFVQKSNSPKPEEAKTGGNISNPMVEKKTYLRTKDISGLLNKGPIPGRIPAGVPLSFLIQQQNIGAITPQLDNAQYVMPPGQQQQAPREHTPIHVRTNSLNSASPQQYSPSEVYDPTGLEQDPHKDSESPDSQAGQKRLSAFQRLGPLTQPKKPKLTINLLCNKDQSVREVLDETDVEDKFAPVHQREDIRDSTDETVTRYLPHWPWKRPVPTRKNVTARNSKSVMLLELEQMDELYERENMFILLSVKGYPPFWKKEHVLDVVLDAVKGKSFIPCFIEFTPQECKFFVIRSRAALTTIHKIGFHIRKDDVELGITISHCELSLKQIDFIPRLILRKRLAQGYDGERKLILSEFTTKYDISHFIYFPLNRVTNQTELVQLQSAVAWDYLTDLDLSHNRITSLEGFNLPSLTPRLKNLDISYNYIDKITYILRCRDLSLRTLKVEGNPLCHDYIDPGHYVKVFRMIFPGLIELDGVPIQLRGEFPSFKRNHCPLDATHVVDRFLEIYFPLLEAPLDDRPTIANLYEEKATLTLTLRYKLRYSPVFRYFRSLFNRARSFDEGEVDSIDGAEDIAKLITKWPPLQHDPYTFSVDVMHHSDQSSSLLCLGYTYLSWSNGTLFHLQEALIHLKYIIHFGPKCQEPTEKKAESSTIIRVCGLLKLTAETLADDEHLLHFTRTLVLTTKTGAEYKILNEMLYWDLASKECADKAFHVNTITSIPLTLKFESPPDADLKEKLLEIFIKITALDKKASERCLEMKEWHLKNALEYYKITVTQDNMSILRN